MYFEPISEPVAIASSSAAYVSSAASSSGAIQSLPVLPTLIAKMSARAACAKPQAGSSPLRLEAAQVPAT
eukprot:1429584-Pleurochrysis_carterae.AAC.1